MAGETSTTEAATYPRGFARETDWQWPMVPARKLVTLNYGRALKADTRSPGKVPVFGTNGQCGWHDAPLAKAPGLILGRKGQGPLGVEWCDKDFWVIDTAYYAITLTPDIDLKYLYHLVKYVGLNHLKDGTSNPTLSRDTFGAQLYPLPPLAEQKAIAAILGALDDKIELNRRMNATLEAMARALFQSWFVDFDPVRAKLDGHPPAGVDRTTATLFPDSFQDAAVGHIPHGWKVGVLDELTKFVIGGDWGATEPTDDETVSCYCIRGADIPSLQSGGVGKMPTRFLKPASVEKRQLADGDLAIEISGGSPTQCTGRPVLASDALLQNLGLPLVASNFCRIVKLKSPALSKFVYLWLRRLYDAGELFQFETGTTGIKNFAFVIFSERYQLVVPDLRVAEAFDRSVSPLFARIQANSQESRTLATLRDTLLPKLLSGELSVDHALVNTKKVL